jgi:alpha-L-fucosidase
MLLAQGCNQAPTSSHSGAIQPKRPADFKPFRYKYTIEQLYANFSEDMMKRAADDMKKLADVNEKGPYKPTVESLDKHPMPEWFEDAKLGFFMDWGPWTAASYATPRDPKQGTGGSYPDWYEFLMNTAYKAYHDSVFGADFRRDDLLPMLTGSNFNAEEYMNLAVKAGAKYFVPFSRHHGGWAMWESQYTFRNAMEMGPKRDIYKEIADAARKKGIKLGLYFSVSEWEYPVIVDRRVTQWDPTDHLGVFKDGLGLFLEQRAYPSPPKNIITGFFPAVADGMSSGKIPVRDYYSDYMMPLFKEAVDKFDPDIVWYDGSGAQPEVTGTPKLSAYYYNQAIGRKDVVINDRAGSSLSASDMAKVMEYMGNKELEKAMAIYNNANRLGDYRTPEYNFVETASDGKKWEVCRSISPAFGYNWTDSEENSQSSEELIKMFIGIVAGNGNLLLVINPDRTGKLSEVQKSRLVELGAWLKVNGEGIYATRPWSTLKEGNNYFTRSKDGKFVYVHCIEWPGKTLIVKGISPVNGSVITMLGVNNPFQWKKTGTDLEITIPDNLQNESNRTCKYAWVMKVQVK